MHISVASFDPQSVEADALIIPVLSVDKALQLGGPGAGIDSALNGELTRSGADSGFTARAGATLSVTTLGAIPARRVILAGLGAAPVTVESARRAYGSAVKVARDAGANKVAIALPEGTVLHPAEAAEAAAEAALLATYRFTDYVGAARKDDPGLKKEIAELVIQDGDGVAEAVARGQARANGINLARDLSNEPASTLNPIAMAKHARKVARDNHLEITILKPKDMAKLGMGAITAVGQGSANPPRMIHLVYKPRPEVDSGRSIGLVGKCITFDTGGYSIKTYEGMLEMKGDMSGGSSVLGAMSVLRAVDCPHTVHAVICAAENMISGDAFRPGDILKAMNGVTIEVLSTDAEGRLVLADGLVYCAKQGVEEMIDLATLTGAIVAALGNGTAGLFSNDDALANRLLAAAGEAGERIWRMPLTDELEEQIKGDVGDIKNSGGRGNGGAITAALFLQHFDEGLPWAHLDIAGCNRTAKPSAYTPKGATGWGVRTLVEYLTSPNGGQA
jgi:leucyl aminopeptidase